MDIAHLAHVSRKSVLQALQWQAAERPGPQDGSQIGPPWLNRPRSESRPTKPRGKRMSVAFCEPLPPFFSAGHRSRTCRSSGFGRHRGKNRPSLGCRRHLSSWTFVTRTVGRLGCRGTSRMCWQAWKSSLPCISASHHTGPPAVLSDQRMERLDTDVGSPLPPSPQRLVL